MISKINFDSAFAAEDSDHLKKVAVDEHTLYVTFHYRKRVFTFPESRFAFHIREAFDDTFAYTFPRQSDLVKVFNQIQTTPEMDWNKFKRDVRQYVPTREGKAQ